MQVTGDLLELRKIRASMAGTFGLVPTMGALHEGHASLIRRAGAECDHVGVSVFVNPSQFGPGEDLGKYPRRIGPDLEMLERLGVAAVFTPAVQGMYPDGYQTWIAVEDITIPLEGKCRPGHFRGVATIVAKLFNAFRPDRAYFGQKDAQQAAVIRRMILDLNFPVEPVVCPTVREADGLAMSSRNAYLDPRERKAAAVLYRALAAARERYQKGEREGNTLRAVMRAVLDSEPLARPEYVSAAHPDTLREVRTIETGAGVLISLAVKIGETRLIDNMIL
ncbi:MAG: pantoate--beta-alanine ligase [Acidobacteria bacterium]|nr:pantoate--beta-alanine ligase [Acidobacteriota bacterium]